MTGMRVFVTNNNKIGINRYMGNNSHIINYDKNEKNKWLI